jgi:hypothetical protein
LYRCDQFIVLLADQLEAKWGLHPGYPMAGHEKNDKTNKPKNGSYPAVVIRSDVIHGGSGRVIFATT